VKIQAEVAQHLSLAAAFLIVLSGCGVVPAKVVISDDKATVSESGAIGYPFRQRRSVILLKQDSMTKAFKAEVSPYELDGNGQYEKLHYIAGKDNFRSTTQLKISYLDNTKLIDQIELTTQDNIADTINKIGTVAEAVVPIVAGGVAGTSDADKVVFQDTVYDPGLPGGEKWAFDLVNSGYCIRQQDIAVEAGLTIAEYVKNASANKYVGDFPVPSCVSATIEIAQCDVANAQPRRVLASIRTVYASATNVTPLPLPSSGKIKMNSVCGASVTEADKQVRTDLTTYLTTLITNVNNVKAAAKKKDK
jgi:hypothetical protein